MKLLQRSLNPSAWSIRKKLSVALLSVALIPMGFTAYFNLQDSLQTAEDGEYRKLELLAVSNASRLDQLITDIQRVVVQVSTERNIVGFLAELNRQDTFRANMQRSLDNVFRSNPDYDAVYILNKKGQCLAATDPSFVGQSYAFREYFQQAIRGESYVSGILVGRTSNKPGIYFSQPVRANGHLVGVAVLKIKGEEIRSIVNELQSGAQSHAFLIDQQGIIISHPDKNVLYHSLTALPPQQQQYAASDKQYGIDRIENLNVSELATAMIGAKEPGHVSYYSHEEQMRQMVGFAPLDMQPWVLGVSKPIAQFSAPLNRLIWQSVLAVVLLGAIAAAIAILLAQSIAKPIRALTKVANALVKHDEIDMQQLTEASHTHDDIGQLVRVFSQMVEEIKTREQKLKQQLMELNVEIDEVKKVRQVNEITQTDYFQEIQKKALRLKGRSAKKNDEADYLEQLQQRAQSLRRSGKQA
jgi:C4-dicarboxylate-specific signal transduction histidine kinase